MFRPIITLSTMKIASKRDWQSESSRFKTSSGGAPSVQLLHEHEVAVQTAPQPGNCSLPPGTYRSRAIEYCLLRFQVHVRFHVCLRLSWTSTLLAVGITPTTTAGFSKGLPALPTEFTGKLVYF